ncbi:MAG: response regulator [Candidatus Tritonobacter lacicola]|nr:response regulator [Candidatus Tritonobacter lacicola]
MINNCERKASILVVDDDPELRHVLTTLLKDNGYSCDEACDGPAAIGMIRKNRYDVIFMDLLMPGLSGCDTISEIHSISPGTPVAVISIVSDEAAMKELFDAGAAVYIRKPFKIEEVIRTAENLISKNRGAP